MFMQELAREERLDSGFRPSCSVEQCRPVQRHSMYVYWRRIAPHRDDTVRKTTLSNLAFFLLFRTPLSLASLATVSRGNVLRKRNQPTNCCPTRCASANADLRDLSIGRFFRGFDRWLRNCERGGDVISLFFSKKSLQSFLNLSFLESRDPKLHEQVVVIEHSSPVNRVISESYIACARGLRSSRSHVDSNLIEFHCISKGEIT